MTIVGYFVTTRMGATRIGFSRPAGFDLGLRNGGVYISGPEFEISRPEYFNLHRSDPQRSGTPNVFRYYANGCYANWFFAPSRF